MAISQALDWLVSKDVKVINMSLAGPPDKLLERALQKAMEHNVVVVAAAGNGGPTAPPAYPAAYDNVIAVTAVDRFKRVYHKANQGFYISFAAPGVSIWTPDEKSPGKFRSGTSFASAYVTAMAAEFYDQANSKVSQDKILNILKSNVFDLGDTGKDSVFGWGLVRYPKKNIINESR